MYNFYMPFWYLSWSIVHIGFLYFLVRKCFLTQLAKLQFFEISRTDHVCHKLIHFSTDDLSDYVEFNIKKIFISDTVSCGPMSDCLYSTKNKEHSSGFFFLMVSLFGTNFSPHPSRPFVEEV
jgi:hypothetical protein